ncbi:MAG: tRNA (uridine(34)/cytosine(34)/5-carboxymethylaminomethyluridine(34)-2'-O)-methyltransferase TrmL [Clostridia bacterium]|nr:tRNA (uridine(34)/cytosine(34)/5-carboxymethylaminomethyluridine(34)-2'-O)-methyltransferase TrmL [Clostridia bacterium]
MHVALITPEIPQNTGNIARTCAATGTKLHLVGPLGFILNDKRAKRAGLDYWQMADITVHDDLETFLSARANDRLFYLSTKAEIGYHQVTYHEDDFLVFGCETRGLPENLLNKYYDRCIRIPMLPGARSLNLSNAVAIVLFEALRQMAFPGLLREGALTGRPEAEARWLDWV